VEKAKNVIEVAQIFDPLEPLTKDEESLYVSLYNDKLTYLRTQVLINKIPSKTFFISGQSGNGKSTALNFFPNPAIENAYHVKYLPGIQLFPQNDIDIIDVLLMIGFEICKDQPFEEEYYHKLDELRKINLDLLQKSKETKSSTEKEAGAKAGAGVKQSLFLKFNLSFFSGYRINNLERDNAREIFGIDKSKLVKLVNEIIQKYHEIVTRNEKKLLIIIDDLEKIRNLEKMQTLFVDDSYIFNEVECVKIIPLPTHLTRVHSMYQMTGQYHFGLRLHSNPLDAPAENEKSLLDKNRELLEQVIYQRLEDRALFEEKAVELAVEKSGCNLRQLVELVYHAASNALATSEMSATQITTTDMEAAVKTLADRMSHSVMERSGLMATIGKEYTLGDQAPEEAHEKLTRCLLDNVVFSYANGTRWYEINPLATRMVEVYAKVKLPERD